MLNAATDGPWGHYFTLDGEITAPLTAEEALGLADARATLEVHVGVTRMVCFFFEDDEIQFAFDPSAIKSQGDLDAICEFMRLIGRLLRKPVYLTLDSGSVASSIITYWPGNDNLVGPH